MFYRDVPLANIYAVFNERVQVPQEDCPPVLRLAIEMLLLSNPAKHSADLPHDPDRG